MMYRPVLPIWRSLPITPIVLLLHPPEQATVACELLRGWQQATPGAAIFAVSVGQDSSPDLSDLPTALLSRGGRRKRPRILAGVCGAEAAALQLGFDRRAPQCARVS